MYNVRSGLTILSLWKAHVFSNWRRTLLSLITILFILMLFSQVMLLAYSYRLNALNVPANSWEPDFHFSNSPLYSKVTEEGLNYSLSELKRRSLLALEESLEEAGIPLVSTRGVREGSFYHARLEVEVEPQQMDFHVFAVSENLLSSFFGIRLTSDQAFLLNVELTDMTERSIIIDRTRSFVDDVMKEFPIGGKLDLLTPIFELNFGSYRIVNVINKELALTEFKESKKDVTDLFDFLFMLRPEVYDEPSYSEAPMFIHILLVNEEGFHQILENFNTNVIDIAPFLSWSWHFVANIKIDLQQFKKTMDFGLLRRNYELARRLYIAKIRPSIEEYGWLDDTVDFSEKYDDLQLGLLWRIEHSQDVYFTVFFYVIAMGLPVIAIAILLGNFTMNLSKRGIRYQLGSLKSRGAGSEQLFMMLWLEVLFFLGLSSLLIPLISIPLANFTLKSSAILDFSGETLLLIIPDDYLLIVIVMALALGVIFKFRSIFYGARLSVSDSMQPIVEHEPFWKRHNVDLFLLLFGLFEVWLINELFRIFHFTGVIGALYPLLLIIGFSAPLLIILGMTMIFTRFLPHLISLLEKITSFFDFKLLTFFLKDIRRRSYLVSRAAIVITLGIAMSMVIFAFPDNTASQSWTVARYAVGSDIQVSHPLNGTFQQQLQQNLSKYTSPGITPFIKLELVDYTNFLINDYVKVKILGIDPDSFLKGVYYEDWYGFPRLGVKNALQTLKEHPLSSLFMFSGSLKGLHLSNGGNLSLFSNIVPILDQDWTIIDTYDYWPAHVQQSDQSRYALELHLVMTIDAVITLVNQAAEKGYVRLSYYKVFRTGYFIKLNTNDYQLHQDVRRYLTIEQSLSITTAIDQPRTEILDGQAIISRSLYGSVNLVTVMGFVVLASMIFMYGIAYQKERWKELGVERVLGMNRYELFLFSGINIFLILAITTILGFFFGLFGTNVLMEIAQLFNTASVFPPAVVLYPIEETILFVAALFIIAIGGSLASALYATRREISNILKVE